jgi:hypothetical protein
MDTERYMGSEKIPVPRKDKNGNYEKGELERVMSVLGLPKTPDEYKTSEKFALPEGVEIDAQMLKDFQVRAHQAGFLPHQYAFMMDELANILAKGEEQKAADSEKAYNEAALALRTKFGATYAQKEKLANNVLRTFSDKTKGAEIIEKYGNDPLIIELLANIGDNLSEDALTKIGVAGGLLTPEAAAEEIKKIRADLNHPYFKAEHPDHQYWINRMNELYKMVTPA